MASSTPANVVRLALAVVCACALVAVSPEPGNAAAKRPAVSNAKPIAGEVVVFKGRLSTTFKRTVAVQRKSKGAWRTVKRARTTSKGAYRVKVRATSARARYRIKAPRTRHAGARYKTVVSRTAPVRPVAQSGSTSSTAPAAQRVSTGASSYAASLLRTPVQATFTPARPGRPVRLQRWEGSGWRTVGSGRQDAAGGAVFQVLPGNAGRTFRAVADPSRGAKKVTARAVALPRWKEIFADDFRGSSLDTSTWGHRNVDNSQGVVGSRKASAARRDTVSVSGGAASLRVKPMACGTARTKALPNKARGKGCFANAQIGTDSSTDPFTFRYGVLAARIKFERGGGMHGAFWSPDPQFARPAGAEIDVAEYFGDGRPRGGLAQFIHNVDRKQGGEVSRNWLLKKGRSWSSDYHVYSVEWTPTQYVFRIDGRAVFSARGDVSREKQALVLSMLSSDWEIPAIKRGTVAGDPMKVDWVRVWQR